MNTALSLVNLPDLSALPTFVAPAVPLPVVLPLQSRPPLVLPTLRAGFAACTATLLKAHESLDAAALWFRAIEADSGIMAVVQEITGTTGDPPAVEERETDGHGEAGTSK